MKLSLAICISLIATNAFAGEFSNGAEGVSGYSRENGSYVQPYERSQPDSTVTNNYSYKGNENTYTGSTGNERDANAPTSSFYNGGNSSNSYGSTLGGGRSASGR